LRELVKQIMRDPFKSPFLWINPNIKTLEDLNTWARPSDFTLLGYNHHSAIKFPFSV
jgi:thymidylate synthase